MSTGSQGCYGNIWESAYTHTHSRCVRVRRFGSAYTCSYALLIRHVVRSQKPWQGTGRGEQGRVYKRRLPCTARRTAAWLPGGTIVEPASLPARQPQGQRGSLSLSLSLPLTPPVSLQAKPARVVSSGCRMDLVCHVCAAAACSACLMSTTRRGEGTGGLGTHH